MIRRIKKKTQTVIATREELTEIFLRLRKKYADLLLEELKNCSQSALEELIIELLHRKDSSLYIALHKPGTRAYIKLLCGQSRRIGLSQVLSFTTALDDRIVSIAAVSSTSGYTGQVWKEANALNTHLLDLQQLIEPLLPPSYPSRRRQNKAAKNITFLP